MTVGWSSERRNRRGIVRPTKDRRARDEDVGPCRNDLCCIVRFDPAVHLKECMTLGLIDQLTCPHDFLQYGRDELLSSESRIHRHDQEQIDVAKDFFHADERGRGIQRDAGLDPPLFDGLNRAVKMRAGLHVHREIIGPASAKSARNASAFVIIK